MKKILIFAEQVFTILSLLMYSGAIFVVVLSGGAGQTDLVEYDSSVIRIIYSLIYLVTLVLLILRWKKTLYFLRKDFWLYSLILLSAVSIIWSFEPSTTLKNSFSLINSSLFGLYFASRYNLKQQLHLLAWNFAIIIVLSFVFAIALPKYGIQSDLDGSKWRGVFTHKNGLGARMVTSSMTFFILGYQTQRRNWLFWAGFGLSIILLRLSASGSSLVNLLIIILTFFGFQIWRWSYQFMVPTLIMIATIGQSLYFWLSSNANVLFNAIGKDATLTGRTELWPLVIDKIWKHPWLGYGYGGFWQGWNGESADIWLAAAWTPSHPHNGYLALCLDLGLLGLGVFFFGFWRNYLQGFAWVRSSKTAFDIWPLIHMTYILLSSLTESNLMESNSLTWILYVAASLSVKI
ncbi:MULTISPECIES: O-antigen ligase family protein [unclassified Nostoc]|uniref:O-antigen ligase family protein n=1 Tax=unclassified Nostoc TaxID=2593658 RepID=UPI002AD529CC|nr:MULTISPECIES: O-antigen ligase family protein [unclassified Nostoc]MDZ8031987.1 O-antigen ligase family protein [Nostoc sp. DedSLP04]MDZ8131647.1 O-antigen ligase family protein [Nostoc sp. DedQUE07]